MCDVCYFFIISYQHILCKKQTLLTRKHSKNSCRRQKFIALWFYVLINNIINSFLCGWFSATRENVKLTLKGFHSHMMRKGALRYESIGKPSCGAKCVLPLGQHYAIVWIICNKLGVASLKLQLSVYGVSYLLVVANGMGCHLSQFLYYKTVQTYIVIHL